MKAAMQCLHAERIYTGRAVAEDAYLVVNGTEIVGLSSRPKGTLAGEFSVITPAFIDAHTHIGMARSGEPSSEEEANEQMDTILALSDALDSVQMDDSSFKDAVEMGVLYSCVVPGSGNIVGGLSAVIRNYGKNSTEALICRAGLKAAFGYNPMSTHTWKGTRPTTRMGAAAILRKRLNEVSDKVAQWRKATGKKKEEISFSAEERVLREVLERTLRLRVHVHKIDDIAVLLRLVDDFQLMVSVEHAMDVFKPEIFQKLKKRNIPVVYGPLDSFAYKVELKHENWRNVRCLLDSGVAFGLMSDHPVTPERQILLQTRWFIRQGLSKQEAVEIVCRRNAEVLEIDHVLGTLDKGKWASCICWNGDPFDLTRYPVAVYGEGQLLYRENVRERSV